MKNYDSLLNLNFNCVGFSAKRYWKNWYPVERLNFQTKYRLYFPNKKLAILMEYNYAREFRQPHKIYSIKGIALPFAPSGIRLEQIFVGIGILILLLISAIISLIVKTNFFTTIIANFWLILIVGVGVLVWTLFSLKWDNKSFLDYLTGRENFLYQGKKRYKHGLLV